MSARLIPLAFCVVFAAVLMLVVPVPVLAENAVPPAEGAAAPVEISADQGLVWNRAAKSYTARGKAAVVQGDTRVTADMITAHYASEDAATAITEIVAEGNVTLTSPPYVAHGDRAVYRPDEGTAELTGGDLRVLTPTETLRARDRLTYAAAAGRMTAEGDARLERGSDTLQAARLEAAFVSDAAGARAVDTVTATGGVVLTTPREKITGARGVYHVRQEKAELSGGVVIMQGPNRLQGDRATMNMKTGLSTMHSGAGAGGDGRVRGIFYPRQEKTAQTPEKDSSSLTTSESQTRDE